MNIKFDHDFINGDFLDGHVRVGNERLMIFSTEQQLHHLLHARRWFVDCTFKSVAKPFYQLFSIHDF
ncbi:hypothetical protein ACF0H5_001541 [Mactra antiquata]